MGPTVWADALLRVTDDELVLALLLAARRTTGGAVFETLANFARERGLDEMLKAFARANRLPAAERDEAVTVRAIAGGRLSTFAFPRGPHPRCAPPASLDGGQRQRFKSAQGRAASSKGIRIGGHTGHVQRKMPSRTNAALLSTAEARDSRRLVSLR